jgi:hypothetical protein
VVFFFLLFPDTCVFGGICVDFESELSTCYYITEICVKFPTLTIGRDKRIFIVDISLLNLLIYIYIYIVRNTGNNHLLEQFVCLHGTV